MSEIEGYACDRSGMLMPTRCRSSNGEECLCWPKIAKPAEDGACSKQCKAAVERDGANERAGLLLKAKDEWAERARAAEEEAIQLRAAISDPESVFVNMKRGTIAKPSLRSMLDLYGEVVNGDEAQLLEIGKLRAEVEMLRSDRKACLEEFKALRRSADETERELRAEVEALRLLAGELYQVLGALDAPAGVLDAVLAAAHGESMGGRDSLLPFVSAEHEALREDAERYRWLRDKGLHREIFADSAAVTPGRGPFIMIQLPSSGAPNRVALGSGADAYVDAAMAAKEGV